MAYTMALLKYNRNFELYTEANYYDIEAILTQKCWAIGYASRIINPAERNSHFRARVLSYHFSLS